MGRFYHGDIQGKFLFGIQSSTDASNLGAEGKEIIHRGEPIGMRYHIKKKDLGKIKEALEVCCKELGEDREKIDQFFNENPYYTQDQLAYAICPGFGDPVRRHISTMNKMSLYGRILLGEKIVGHLENNPSCKFIADYE